MLFFFFTSASIFLQGYCVYRVAVRRGSRKRPNHRGIVFGKPKHQGINQIRFKRSLRSVAEERAGERCPNLRVLNSYWVNQASLLFRLCHCSLSFHMLPSFYTQICYFSLFLRPFSSCLTGNGSMVYSDCSPTLSPKGCYLPLL